MYERNLILHQSVAGIVATYQQAQKEITTASGLLDQVKKCLKLTGIDDNVLEPNARDYDLHCKCQDTITILRQNTWRVIIGKCNIKEYFSSSRSLEIESQLRDDQLPLPKSMKPLVISNGNAKPNISLSAGTKKAACTFALNAWTWSAFEQDGR